jgi:sugar phosphate isomerase/epimerase
VSLAHLASELTMMNRRAFLRTAGLTAAAGWGGVAACRSAAGGAAASTASAAAGALPPLRTVGLQLSTVRALIERDIAGTFRDVAAIGYRTVETSADFYEKRKPADVRALLDAHGLSSPVGLYREEAIRDDTAGVIRAARTIGQRYVGLPSLSDASRGSREGYRQAAGRYNEWGRRLKAEGLTLTYHNHAFEFETLGGDSPAFDLLLGETDPQLVAFELDLYWVHKGGHDPVAYFERYPGRFPLFHLKDSTAAPEKAFAPVGAGVMDFRRILSHAERAGMRHGFVEHDKPDDPMTSIRTSYANLVRLLPSG